jgi:hypothetical protein
MKQNKAIKLVASITTMGAIGAGTVVAISSCNSGSIVDTIDPSN